MNYFELLRLFNPYKLYQHRKEFANIFSCAYHPSNVYRKIGIGELEPCDMFLFHGHSLINKAIQSLTDSMYNHVALNLDNKSVLHAVQKGFIQQDFKDAIRSDEIVHVYRYHYRGVGGEPLSEVDKTNILFKAYQYRNAGLKYATPELFELAFLCQLRADSDILKRSKLDTTFREVNDLIQNGVEIVTCGEGYYLIFDGTGYPIRIIPEGWHEEYRKSDSPLLKLIREHKDNILKIDSNFVTPHDLAMSPDFGLVGVLQL
jgi:hypothetical protein